MLLFQGGGNRHNAFGKAATGLALSAETALTPQDTGTNLSFGQVIGGVDPFNLHESPQRGFAFEDVTTSTGCLAVIAVSSLTKQLAHFGLNGFHFVLKNGSAHGAITDFMPPFKHQVRLG